MWVIAAVHKTSLLQPDRRLLLLAVRVSVVDASTGTYLKKSNPERAVTAPHDTRFSYILPVLTKVRSRARVRSPICWKVPPMISA